MHKNGTLLTQTQILTMMQALEGFNSSDESTVRAAPVDVAGETEQTAASPVESEDPASPAPARSEGGSTSASAAQSEETKKGDGPQEIVLSVEQAAGIAIGAVLFVTILVKRNSVRSMFRTNISRVGDAVFGP